MANKKRRTKEKIRTRKRISKFVKQIRLMDELKQEDLADEIFVTRKAISKWETNMSSPSVDSVNELSKAYNVTFEEIVHGKLLPDEQPNKVLKIIFSKPITIIMLFLLLYFIILMLTNYYNNNRVYYFNFKSNNYTINKGMIYIVNDNLVIDISDIKCGKDHNLNLEFKMDIINKRKTIYKCNYYMNNCDSYYVKENITKRMIRNNNIYLYIEDKEGIIFNKIKVYKMPIKNNHNKRDDFCAFKNCKYHFGLLNS